MPPDVPYTRQPDVVTSMVREQDIETDFLSKLDGLKYTLRPDIRDRAMLEQNFREKFEALIHTDAIKETLIPPTITKTQASFVYANEADLLNVALFGQTAKKWHDAHPDAEATSATTPRWSSSLS